MAKEGLPFGRKMSEVAAEVAPATEVAPVTNDSPPAGEPVKAEPPQSGKETKVEPTKSSWIEEVNKSFKTEFKTPDDFGKYLEKAKKADEYEPKIKGYEESEKNYKKQLEELQRSLNPLEYFSSQESFVAEQLRKQRPDLNPRVLQEVVSEDMKGVSDFDVLVKNLLLETPNLKGGERGAEEQIRLEYGIDETLPQDEWPVSLQNRLLIKANAVRKQWNELKTAVKVPKVATPEERATEQANLAKQKAEQIKPYQDTFSNFNEFTEEIDEGKQFKFIPPDDYKAGLPDMFKAFFVDAGMEVNKENLDTINELRDALLLRRNFKQIYKTIEGEVETRMRAERDALLNNQHPLGTQSGAELESDEAKKFSNQFGIGKLLGKK